MFASMSTLLPSQGSLHQKALVLPLPPFLIRPLDL